LNKGLGLSVGKPVIVKVRRVLPPGEGVRRSAGAYADAGDELDRWLEGVYRDRDNDREQHAP